MKLVNTVFCLMLFYSGGYSYADVANEQRCADIADSVKAAGFDDTVTVSCNASHARIHSTTYPAHEMMTGIVNTNEQVPIPADYTAPILLRSIMSTTPLTRDAALGVAVNGVPIFDYTAGGDMSVDDLAHHQAKHDTVQTQQLDVCGGHAGRGDDYHYHAKPTCMINNMENAGDDAIIGWAFDGYPIYGDNNPDGSLIAEGALDVCNGQPDEHFGYRYHTSNTPPYIVQCLMGEVELNRMPRVRPLVNANGGKVMAGKPPRGGVDNLVYTEADDGWRRMSYEYSGDNFFIQYRPSNIEGCYDVEKHTVTNGEESGTYCR